MTVSVVRVEGAEAAARLGAMLFMGWLVGSVIMIGES